MLSSVCKSVKCLQAVEVGRGYHSSCPNLAGITLPHVVTQTRQGKREREEVLETSLGPVSVSRMGIV